MKSKRWVILAVVVTGAVGGLLHLWHPAEASSASDGLVLYGNVDIRQVELAFRVPGRLEEVLYEEGDRVEPGSVVARIDRRPFVDDLRHAEAEVAVRRAEHDKYQTGARPEEIEQARARVREELANVRNARIHFKRQSQLAGTGATSLRAVDDARAAKDSAEARLRSAREALELEQQGFRAEDIAAAHAALQVAEAQLARAQTDLVDTEVFAPAGGVILSRIREPGAIVAAGAPVYTLTIDDPVWVRTYVGGPALGRVQPGLAAEIRTDSFPEEVYRGQVGFISPEAEFTPRSVETPELRTDLVYRLRIIVDDPDAGLRQGMPVTVTLPAVEGRKP